MIETAGSEAELRRQMRAKNGVTERHTGIVLFSHVPTESAGFIVPSSLGRAVVTKNLDLALERVATTANAYEIHKLADGSRLLVGFMGKEIAPQLTPSERTKNLRLSR